jgi:DNA-binding GntR family transcriptional regulator
MLRKQARILRSLSLFTKDRFSSSLKEHVGIAEAYKKGNPTLLVRAVKFHLEMFKENIVDSDFLKEELSFNQKKIGKFAVPIV